MTFTVQVSWSTNFAVMGTWSWISDTTTNNSTFPANCYRQTTCKVLVREKGHVYIDWVSLEGGNINLTPREPRGDDLPTPIYGERDTKIGC